MDAKKRCLRTRRPSDSESEEEKPDDVTVTAQQNDGIHVVEAIRELQRVRKRPAGISLSTLNTGKPIPEEMCIVTDPFKLKTGGLVEMRKAMGAKKKTEEEDDVEARLAKTFATETNKRDEDAEMIKYIEEEIARRKGLRRTPSPEPTAGSDLLQDVPEHLRPVIGQQKEDMLSNQMLCGIPEIDLGVEAKMRNIEATEEAKQTLLKHRFNRRHQGGVSDGLAPANVAVNFVQHSRWNSHSTMSHPDGDIQRDLQTIASKLNHPGEVSARKATPRLDMERERLGAERSTDTLALQRFKSHMRGRKRR